MVDWLVEVCITLELLNDTLFLACNLMDQYLNLRIVPRKHFQLLGITALMIAAKKEEIIPPALSAFEYMAANAADQLMIAALERKILQVINYKLTSPLPLSFLRRYSKASRADSQQHTLSKYLIELTLLDVPMMKFLPSQIAASAVYLTRLMLKESILWTKTLEHYSGFTLEDFKPCIIELYRVRKEQDIALKYRVIYNKYAQKKLYKVSDIACPSVLEF